MGSDENDKEWEVMKTIGVGSDENDKEWEVLKTIRSGKC